MLQRNAISEKIMALLKAKRCMSMTLRGFGTKLEYIFKNYESQRKNS